MEFGLADPRNLPHRSDCTPPSMFKYLRKMYACKLAFRETNMRELAELSENQSTSIKVLNAGSVVHSGMKNETDQGRDGMACNVS